MLLTSELLSFSTSALFASPPRPTLTHSKGYCNILLSIAGGIIGINDNTGNSWRTAFIAHLKIKKDSSGNINGITFTDSGCIVEDSRYTSDSNLHFSGGYKIKGKKVDTSKLPFNP
jgi:hypothetical protein